MDENISAKETSEETACESTSENPSAADLSALTEENERLQKELETLKAQIADEKETAEAEAHLAALTGGREERLFAEAIRQSAEHTEWQTLPRKQRYELAYYLCLGREEHAAKAKGAQTSQPPAFARSGGQGDCPSMPMKTPTNFEMARENAMKYFARG